MLSLHTQVVYLQQAANLPMIAQDKKKCNLWSTDEPNYLIYTLFENLFYWKK
jgi:hypothetical protein